MKTKLALTAFVAAFMLGACGSKTEAPAPVQNTTVNPAPAPGADAAASSAADSAAAAKAAADAAAAAAASAASDKKP